MDPLCNQSALSHQGKRYQVMATELHNWLSIL